MADLNEFWLFDGRLMTPRGIVDGAVRIARGRIAAIRPSPPRAARRINAHGAYVAPGFIDVHLWGDPQAVSREAARHGTTAFLTSVAPDAPAELCKRLTALQDARGFEGAQCVGAHLEGPFLNPRRAGALPARWMRPPSLRELRALAARGGLRMMTMAPELPGAREAIRWCRARRIVVSLGHSDADAAATLAAVDAGASAVTHVFNAMRPFHHREPTLLGVALTDDRLTAMVILDGVHVDAYAFRLLLRAKGAGRVALVTDSIRHQGWRVTRRRGAYYTRHGVLAGSGLTMIRAVRNATASGGASLEDGVRMASETPARLLGLDRDRGTLATGKRADLVVFDRRFRARLTIVGGHVVYQA